jgi:hypothetical protein
MTMISEELEKHIIERWNEKSSQQGLKKGTKTYFNQRLIFLSGVLSVIDFGKKETECTPRLYFSILQNKEWEDD